MAAAAPAAALTSMVREVLPAASALPHPLPVPRTCAMDPSQLRKSDQKCIVMAQKTESSEREEETRRRFYGKPENKKQENVPSLSRER
jgi:hypothetical protein